MSPDVWNTADLLFAGGPTGVRLVGAGSVTDVLAAIKDRLAFGDGGRLVSIPFDRLPIVGDLVEEAIAGLAGAALALWPDWYGATIPLAELDRSTFAFEARLADALASAGGPRRAVSLPWVTAARTLCRSGQPPLPRGFPPAVQAAQLALALEPDHLLIALASGDDQPGEGLLLGLSRAAEWLAREAGARVLVVVPRALASSRELDGISFDAISWAPEPDRVDAPIGRAEESFRVWPILGRPHPDSPGEQRLASRLEQDEELSGLFRFNVRVETRFGSRFLVDLLWPSGKVVVEVDGYGFHSSRHAFAQDRRRDYELLVGGHLVLRLPHDEVMEDVDLAVAKVRDVVRIRQATLDQKGEP